MTEEIQRYKAQDYYTYKDNLSFPLPLGVGANTVKVLPGNCGSPATNSHLDITPMVIIWLMGNFCGKGNVTSGDLKTSK